MIYFLITTCILNNCPLREKQYITGITTLKHIVKTIELTDYKIIIIENNGIRETFLDTFGLDVYYTENNMLSNENKGYKELKDIHDCIQEYLIGDDDFIVKMTGRYILKHPNTFMNIVKEQLGTYDCIIKYGSYNNPVNYQMEDCITGLIGMKCKYIKQIEYPIDNDCVEWSWAKVTYLIDESRIYKIESLMDIHICPGGNLYFFV